jgi:L-cystine transport system substrate-binding protein
VKRVFFFWAMIFSFISVCEGEDQKQELVNLEKLKNGTQTLLVGHFDFFPPFYFYQKGQLTGMDAETMREVASKANIKKISFVSFRTFTEMKTALKEGKISIVANGIADSPLGDSEFLLSRPYYVRGGLGFLYIAGTKEYTTPNDLKKLKIGVLEGSSAEANWLSAQAIKKESVTEFPTGKELIEGLKSAKIEIALSNYTFCRYQQFFYDDRMVSVLVEPMPIAFMLRKEDSDLLEAVNTAISVLWSDGSLFKIKKKYLEPIGMSPSLTD